MISALELLPYGVWHESGESMFICYSQAFSTTPLIMGAWLVLPRLGEPSFPFFGSPRAEKPQTAPGKIPRSLRPGVLGRVDRVSCMTPLPKFLPYSAPQMRS